MYDESSFFLIILFILNEHRIFKKNSSIPLIGNASRHFTLKISINNQFI
jgi:hypothetical protein